MKKYRCVWCIKDTATNPCEFCGNSDSLYVKGRKHTCHWSRQTLSTVKCKICDKIEFMEDYLRNPNL